MPEELVATGSVVVGSWGVRACAGGQLGCALLRRCTYHSCGAELGSAIQRVQSHSVSWC